MVQAYCHGDFDNGATLGVLHLGAGGTVWLRLYENDRAFVRKKILGSYFKARLMTANFITEKK